MSQCPRCGLEVSELHTVDHEIKIKMEASGEGVPPQVCVGCLTDIRKTLATSSGGVLMAQERAKEQHRLQLWKSRVQLVKKGRQAMNQKLFSDAAVAYEKYLKILELVFECKGEKLKPEHFKDAARTSELTVVTSVYWDLFRIYDIHEKYAERQREVAQQLSNFVRFTPIFPDIMKKAQAFQKSAKNPNAVKQLLKLSAQQRPRCFIASSVFGPASLEVLELRSFRDVTLRQTKIGRKFIYFYYRFSPHFAQFLDKNSWLKPTTRVLLRLVMKCVRYIR